MGLTAEEIKKIDKALMALRRSLKDELEHSCDFAGQCEDGRFVPEDDR